MTAADTAPPDTAAPDTAAPDTATARTIGSDLTGRCAIVSGAARGQGAAEARALAAAGAKVVLGDVLDDVGQAVADEIGAAARYCHLDVTRAVDWATAVTTAQEAFGPVSVLVNNAGILRPGSVQRTSPDELAATMEVNLLGSYLGIKAVLDSMTAAGGGSIINISSVGGMLGTPGAVAYVTSKWALRGLTKAAASDLARLGIRVNSVHPGAIQTPMIADGGFEAERFLERHKTRMPIRRMGQPEDVASVVVFLASAGSSYMTGAELTVDGGWVIS
jgi:3alpha(or 20beta)-hydroxysteroid dehydrogenase